MQVQGYDLDEVAAAMTVWWNKGETNPELANHIRSAFPGLSLADFNKAADIAWASFQASMAAAWKTRLDNNEDELPF